MVKVLGYNIDKKKGVIIVGSVATIGIVGALAWYFYNQQKKVSPSVETPAATEPQQVITQTTQTETSSNETGETTPASNEYNFKGIVKDATGTPIAGANIDVQYGSPSSPQSTTTTTDANGLYYINISSNSPPVYASATEKASGIKVDKTVSTPGAYDLNDIVIPQSAPAGAPTAPTNFAATAGDAGPGGSKFVTYTWTNPTTPGDSIIIAYKVYRTGSLPNNHTANQFVRSGAGEAYNPDVYTIYVTAINASGKESPPSNKVTLDTTGTTPSNQGNQNNQSNLGTVSDVMTTFLLKKTATPGEVELDACFHAPIGSGIYPFNIDWGDTTVTPDGFEGGQCLTRKHPYSNHVAGTKYTIRVTDKDGKLFVWGDRGALSEEIFTF